MPLVEPGNGPVVAIIPARGGSKGIPGKNLQRVGGIPLVARTVSTACAATTVDVVVVSTDDEDIAATALGAGARIVRRPDELSGDTATSESAVLHALEQVDGRVVSDRAAIVVMMQCTSPFVTADEVDRTVGAVRFGASCAFTAVRTHAFVWTLADGRAVGVNHDPVMRPRRQERPVEFRETGAAYAMVADGLRRHRHRFFGDIAIVETDPRRSLEIDDEADLQMARTLALSFDSSDSTTNLQERASA